MSIVSWELRPDGKINVWDSPIRYHGRKRVLDADKFFSAVRSLSDIPCGLLDGPHGFCVDPGVFPRSGDYISRQLKDIQKNVSAMMADWRVVHLNAAADALNELYPEGKPRKVNHVRWVMAYLKAIVNEDKRSYLAAYDFVCNAESGYQAVTLRHSAASLRKVLDFGVERVLQALDLQRVVKAIAVDGTPFKCEFEMLMDDVKAWYDLRENVNVLVSATAADKIGFDDQRKRLNELEAKMKKHPLFKIVNGRHPMLGRHGLIYAKGLLGLGNEHCRMRALITLVEHRFADAVDILGVDQVIAGANI